MKLKTDWHTYYACHCDKCKWTGSSEFVLGGGEDGPFYCPYCFHCDPTYPESKFFKVDNPHYSVKEFLIYIVYRAFSIVTTPGRCIYAKYAKYELDKWIERSRE